MMFIDDEVLVDNNANILREKFGCWRVELEKNRLKRNLKCWGLKQDK